MGKLSKVPLLLQSFGRSPVEMCDRIGTVWEVRRDRARRSTPTNEAISLQKAVPMIEAALGRAITPYLTEPPLLDIENETEKRKRLLDRHRPFTPRHDGDTQLAKLCYAAARVIRPETILETGVAYGVTSAFLLQAVSCNGHGRLVSVDLPPLGKDADQYVGFLIPDRLRNAWTLHRGATRRVFPVLLPSLPPLDLFVQDSLHTYRTISAELSMAWRRLRSGGVLVADDVGDNTAFEDFAASVEHSVSVVVRENDKDSAFGVLVKR